MVFKRPIFWLSLVGLAMSPLANATLGGDIASVAQDRIQAKASHRVQQRQGQTVHELSGQFGTTIREYAGADGKVYAVTWAGPQMPDLRQLLGPYFPQYIAESDQSRSGHSQRSVRHDGLVVQSGGRMRAFSGKAYLESAIPTGVDIDALQ